MMQSSHGPRIIEEAAAANFFEVHADDTSVWLPLSLHERAILEALANGAHSKEMAAIIKRSRGTVEFYIRLLFVKLEARSRPHLVAQAFRKGLLPLEDSRDEARRTGLRPHASVDQYRSPGSEALVRNMHTARRRDSY